MDRLVTITSHPNEYMPRGVVLKAFMASASPVLLMVTLTGFHPFALTLAVFPGGFTILVLWILLYMRMTPRAQSAMRPEIVAQVRRMMVSAIGQEPIRIDADVETTSNGQKLTGSGIAWDGAHLFILNRGSLGRIPLGAIRSWAWEIESASQSDAIEARHLGVGMDANAANPQIASKVLTASGLVVHVADSERPCWHFTSRDERLLRRWDSILKQLCDGQIHAPDASPSQWTREVEESWTRALPGRLGGPDLLLRVSADPGDEDRPWAWEVLQGDPEIDLTDYEIGLGGAKTREAAMKAAVARAATYVETGK
ncbi:hypothetical protein ACFQX4_24830 [Roseomonas sp. GCM10028921]